MRTRALLAVTFFAVAFAGASRAEQGRTGEAKPISSPPPKYPYQARAGLLEGSGQFRLHVDRATGAVTKVSVVKSTGHKILDEAGIGAFRTWRFQPNTVDSVRVPLTFELQPLVHTPGGPKAVAISAVRPEYPMEARRLRETGTGIYVLTVDRAGNVTGVEVARSTRFGHLDNAAVAALRRWRFKPNTVTKVRIPVTFTLRAP